MFTEISPKLYLGTPSDAISLATQGGNNLWRVICVADHWPDGMPPCPPQIKRYPILVSVPNPDADDSIFVPLVKLEWLTAFVQRDMSFNRKVLIHDSGLLDRAPLFIAWFLAAELKMTLDQAYEKMHEKCDSVKDTRDLLTDEAKDYLRALKRL